jgi:hypothetical protein
MDGVSDDEGSSFFAGCEKARVPKPPHSITTPNVATF